MKYLNLVLATSIAFLLSTNAIAQLAPAQQQNLPLSYLLNGGFENSASGYKAFKNSAAVVPTNGTGGAPSVTISSSTSSPLVGKASGIFNHPASNVQGEGFSYVFSVDPSASTKVLSIKGTYQIISGIYSGGTNTTDSDIEVYVYDVDAGQLIQPTGYKLNGGVLGQSYDIDASFQVNKGSINHRLIFHSPNITANAFQVKFDDLSIVKGLKTATMGEGSYSAQVQTTSGSFSNQSRPFIASCTAANPTVCTFISGTFSQTPNCFTTNYSGGADTTLVNVASISSTSVGIQTINSINANQLANISFRLICQKSGADFAGLNSSDTRVVSLSAYKTGGSTTANTTVTSWTTIKDTHSSFNASSGVYTIPVPGDYFVKSTLASTTGAGHRTKIYKNGVAVDVGIGADVNNFASPSSTLIPNCIAGDLITIQDDSNLTITTATTNNWVIFRLSGPSQVSASETVQASYWLSANFSASTTTPVNFDSKEFDSHSAVSPSSTAWKFTAPVSGVYSVNVSTATGAAVNYYIYKNGSLYKWISNGQSTTVAQSATAIRLLAGEYIDIRPGSTQTITGGALSANTTASIFISKSGN